MKTPFLQTVRQRSAQLGHRLRETRLAQVVLRFFALCERHSFLTQCLLVVLLRLSLDILYVTVLSPIYGYSGFTTSIQPLFYSVSWIGLLVFLPFVVRIGELRTPSSLMVNFMNYLFFIPATSFAGCYRCETRFFIILLLFWASLLFFQFRLPILFLRQAERHANRTVMILLTVFSSVFVLYISGRYTGFRFTLDITNEYLYRLEAREYPVSAFSSYLLSMLPLALSILIFYWTECRKWLISAALIVVYIFLFSYDTQKSIFFILLLVLVCRFFFREWMLRWASGLLLLFTAAAFAENKIIGTFFLVGAFIRRMMFLPIRLCTQYDSFFRMNPLSLYRDGIMGKLSFSSIYPMPTARIIGEYLGNSETNANTGLLGDLFANLPLFPGIILLPLILVICFRLLDMAAHSSRQQMIVPISFYYACCFVSGFWSTTLLSNGFLLICILLYFYPNEEGLSHG